MRSSNICFKSNKVVIINHIINELRKKKNKFCTRIYIDLFYLQ